MNKDIQGYCYLVITLNKDILGGEQLPAPPSLSGSGPDSIQKCTSKGM